ncbi:hypothetical protein [Burkholderia pseudomallei]|uniref:hypothetical protein n=1 Tax=Burkholderia pseudomallei TaxID=28450 RepID=UPI000F08DA0F|nr:hypothetical protein [Burkholderia pseudomallei]CAJ2725545.1 gp41 [Burkholderia pseudomallei]VCC58091.1 gp41 [Burkholderia pseudomallei]VCC61012.1 gp41 [Burkholderia pseudomallei]VCC69844.1 gp41 [Burkholderia pseudomallei]
MTTTDKSRADAMTDLSDDELALIREEAARITDDWCKRQFMEPSQKESDAKFVREVLRLAASPSSQPAAAPADLQGLRRSILTSREIVRDQDGMLSHPAVPYLDEDVNYETFFAAFGIEATFIHMEDDVDCDTYDRYFASNSPDCCTWTPSSPQGDGWMLLEIYDTEDGPVALYVREKKPESMRERWKREKRESDAAAPSPAEERAASWYCCDPVQICSAQCDSCAKQARAALTAIVDERAKCIAWANANGFMKYHESMCAAWEERARRAAQQLSAEIRELKVKLGSYEREREDQTRYLAAQSEEIAGLKYQLAHADARVELTAEARATIMDACRSISRGADGLKAGCAIGDEWPDAEDKAFYDAELRLLARLVALLNDSGQSEPETATVARIEQLRKALFESRDAMRVMSNWAKKPDPAGHSWAVRMLDRANAALNGEPEPRSELTVSRCFRCGHADHAGPCVNVHPDLAARAGDAE